MSQSVFVLEDDADISRLVQHHLEAAGFGVKPYLTPANVIPDAERQPPALFLLDIMVPGGDGLDVCRRLRSNASLSTIPIIFLTARAGKNDRVLGLELGAPLDLTWSCYSREDRACGVCDSCVLRLRAFAEAGARDPIPYVETATAPAAPPR